MRDTVRKSTVLVLAQSLNVTTGFSPSDPNARHGSIDSGKWQAEDD